MSGEKTGLSRRRVLQMAMGVGGLAFYPGVRVTSGLAQSQTGAIFTPSMILGPFYPQIKPPDVDSDLTLVAGSHRPANGAIVHLSGRVVNLKREPVSGARVSIWQANTHGRYAHKSDANPAPLDPNFQGFGTQITDAAGRYHFKTIKPGAYPAPLVGMRAPHIHFEVEAKYDRLITQMFFPGEQLNGQDHFLGQFARGPQHEAVIARQTTPAAGPEAGALSFVWDIVLISG